jgi:BASS family bile acid:Na+ symporter
MPAGSLHYTDLLLYFILAFITMSLGLSLVKDDFRNLFLQPKSLVIGLLAQMVLLPGLAFLLMNAVDLDPAIRVGFMQDHSTE